MAAHVYMYVLTYIHYFKIQPQYHNTLFNDFYALFKNGHRWLSLLFHTDLC